MISHDVKADVKQQDIKEMEIVTYNFYKKYIQNLK